MRAARGQRNLLITIVRQWKEEKYGELGSVQVSASPSLNAEHPAWSWNHSSLYDRSADVGRPASAPEQSSPLYLGREMQALSGSPKLSGSLLSCVPSGP
jgi:hypothetical protein